MPRVGTPEEFSQGMKGFILEKEEILVFLRYTVTKRMMINLGKFFVIETINCFEKLGGKA